MYSSARAASLNFSWMASTRFISGGGVVDQGVAADPDRGVGPERLDEQRHPQVAAGLEVVLGEDGEVGIQDVVEGQRLLGQPLVLPQVQLARPAAGVADAEQVEDPGHGDVAPDVVAEHLQQVEDQVGLAPLHARDELAQVAVDAEDRRRVPPLAEGLGDLIDHHVILLRAFALHVRQDRDFHRSPCDRRRHLDQTGPAGVRVQL